MPRVTKVEKCRKAQGQCTKCGDKIKVGDPYVWWKFQFGPRLVRCAKAECYPKPSDLTRSEFLGQLYDLQARDIDGESVEDLESIKDELVSDLDSMRSDCEDKRSNMPEQLQDSDTGNLLQERIDALENAVSELEAIDFAPDLEPEPEQKKDEKDEAFNERHTEWEQAKDEALDAIRTEISDALNNISCG